YERVKGEPQDHRSSADEVEVMIAPHLRRVRLSVDAPVELRELLRFVRGRNKRPPFHPLQPLGLLRHRSPQTGTRRHQPSGVPVRRYPDSERVVRSQPGWSGGARAGTYCLSKSSTIATIASCRRRIAASTAAMSTSTSFHCDTSMKSPSVVAACSK